MKQKLLDNLIYQVITKTKKTNLPTVLKKTKLKQINSHNISYTNRYDNTNKNEINPINSDKIEIFNEYYILKIALDL